MQGVIILTLACFIGLNLILYSVLTQVNTHTDSTAMRVCQIEHSFDTCFQALNR